MVMSTGVLVGDLWAVADVGGLWGQAEEYGGRGKRTKSTATDRSVRPTQAGPTQGGPTQAWTGKQRGEMAEAEFVAKAARLGFRVAKPWGDSERYDFIVDVNGRLWRVQVKSAHRAGQDGGYSFRMHGHSLKAYSAKEIDVLVAYVVSEDAWYVFPVRELGGLRSLKLFPGSRRKRSRFEKWREAWGVFERRF
jgi:hypothetical protein